MYAKVLAINGKTQELAALIQDERSEIVATEIEPVLVEHSQFDALTTLYQRHGDARKLLELYSKCVAGILLLMMTDNIDPQDRGGRVQDRPDTGPA